MNYWTELSIEYASQRSYLDDLFQVYPTIPDGMRDINESVWEEIAEAYNNTDKSTKNNSTLVQHLLRLKKFPFKDSYVSFLRLDPNSFARNPNTINRLAGMTFNIELEKLYEKCSQPKETNTQMGGKFRHWINKGVLGVLPVSEREFLANNNNAILAGGDRKLTSFAKEHFGYSKEKGLDFIGRFNGKYVIGEAKFISAIGGNQGTAFTDVITTITADIKNAIPIGIVDGIPWIKDKSPYYKEITTKYSEHNILSSLVLEAV